ncbi:MAG: hypothetical protein ACYCVY_04500 [Acidiferrobacteraceae bacterium]
MEHTFKALALTESVRIWLTEMYTNEDFDPKKARVKLRKDLPKGFNPRSIDSRLCKQDHLTLIGIWHVDPGSPVFRNVTRVIEDIRAAIMREPEIKSISAIQIAARTKVKDRDVERALFLMSELGTFRTVGMGASGCRYSSISFEDLGEDVYDAYLYFDSLDNVMEEFYTRRQGSSEALVTLKRHLVKPDTAFIIASAHAPGADAREICRVIKEVFAGNDIEASSTDDLDGHGGITEWVLKQIRESEYLVADLSGGYPDVYYGVGYAHALGRDPILYLKESMGLLTPLDRRDVREFRDTDDLRNKLATRLRSIRTGRGKTGGGG